MAAARKTTDWPPTRHERKGRIGHASLPGTGSFDAYLEASQGTLGTPGRGLFQKDGKARLAYLGPFASPIAVAIGFVLVKVAPQSEREAYQELMRVAEVVEVYPLFGEFDLIAKVEAPDFDSLGRLVVAKIRTIKGIVETKTLAETKF